MEKNWSLRASSPVSNIWADLALVARARCMQVRVIQGGVRAREVPRAKGRRVCYLSVARELLAPSSSSCYAGQ